jgi:hypothetical protein
MNKLWKPSAPAIITRRKLLTGAAALGAYAALGIESAFATCAKVQSGTSRVSPGSSVVVTLPNPTTTGNLLHLDVSVFDMGSGASPSDGGLNSFTNTINNVSFANGASCSVYSWYAKNITGASSEVVTVNFGGSYYAALTVTEISGALTSSPLGINETKDQAATTTPAFTSTGTAAIGDAVMASLPSDAGANTLTFDTSYTVLFNNYGGAEQDTSVGFKAATGAGAQSVSCSCTTSRGFGITLVSYKAAAAPAAAKSFLMSSTP